MKKILSLILALTLIFSLSACGGDSGGDKKQDKDSTGSEASSVESTIDETETSEIKGVWENPDGDSSLFINADGQAWYIYNGNVIFRGYAKIDTLSENDNEELIQYKLFNDEDELMCYLYHDIKKSRIFEEDEDGEVLDTYYYEGEFQEPPTADNGNDVAAFIVGEWLHSDTEETITFTADGQYSWETENSALDGIYILDGNAITLHTVDGYATGRVDEAEGRLYIEGDAGSYFYKAN